MKKYYKNQDFECDFELNGEPIESMVIATPFFKKKHFYYNQKINCMRAQGTVTLGDDTYTMNKENWNQNMDMLDMSAEYGSNVLEKYKQNILLYQIKLCKDEDTLDHTIPGNYNFLVEKSDDE